VCRARAPGAATPRCLAGLYGAQALLGVALPATVVYLTERRFRRNFALKIQA